MARNIKCFRVFFNNTEMEFKKINYNREADKEFVFTLRKRVKDYFKTNGIERYGNRSMRIKSVFMISLFFIPYFVMVSGIFTDFIPLLALWILIGLGTAGIGLSIMHDANHKSYSGNSKVNQRMAYFLNIVGGTTLNWNIQHNVLHHGYTNVDGYDEDIEVGSLMRLSPHQKKYKLHRWQHFYGWFLYGFMTMSWVIYKDIVDLMRYRNRGLTKTYNRSFKSLLFEVIGWKLAYYGYIFVIPIIVLPVPWWWIPLMFFIAQFLAGFLLASIFQSAHVMPTSAYPQPDDEGNVDNNWAIHQLMTTTNFSPKKNFFTWYIGGLNYQIEHHLFPNICHVHYRNISSIVEETARDYNLPYHVQPTFFKALQQHGKMLRMLGNS